MGKPLYTTTFDRAVIIAAVATNAGAIIVGQLDLVPDGAICWSVILLGREMRSVRSDAQLRRHRAP
jgi:hypothetical protein